MIGVVTTSYPRHVGDPAGSFVADHVAALRALGHDVEVVAARRSHGLFYEGGAPDALERGHPRTWIAAARFTIRHTATVARRARRWDSIIAHWLAPSAIAALPTTLPLIAIAHGGDIHTLRRMHLLRPLLHALRARRARLVFVSDELRAIACASARELAGWLAAATVQPMGVAVDHFAALPRVIPHRPTILVAGRLVPIKGIDTAIAAIPLLATPRAELVIAGDGPLRAQLAARADQLATPDHRITMVGQVDSEHRDRLLAAASVVVVPSRMTAHGRTEGMPMIALEALAAGVPVVASATGGLRELPGPRLVPPDDPAALAAAIDRMLASPTDPDQLRASVAHLAWPKVAQRLLDLP